MKPSYPRLAGLFLCCCSSTLPAEIITQWDFNNSTEPSLGQGTVTLVGGTTASFAAGSTSDPAATGNTGWNTAHYPAQGTSNKMAGVQFQVSTLGYSDISIHWDHRVSSTATKYCRLEYSTGGINFLDMPQPITATSVYSSQSFYEPQTMDLTGIPGVENNPNFAFQIVAEFESSALSYGTDTYVTTYGTNQYSRAGTVRFDMVTVSGTLIPGANTPPQISGISNQVVRTGQSTGPLTFTVSDAEDWPEWLTVTATSSHQEVVPEGNVWLSGYGPERTVEITAGTQPGTARIKLTVTDSGGRASAIAFLMTVLPTNTAPSISPIPGTNIAAGTATTVCMPFTIGDLETNADALTVSAYSANASLLPNDPAHISLGGEGSNRTIVLAPCAGVAGVAPVAVTVSDGGETLTSLFALAVTPSSSVVLYDPFDYANGSVVTNSGLFLSNRSGTNGDCQALGGQLEITGARSEDVTARLAGAPYGVSNSVALYASFKINFQTLPAPTPEYFAHFLGGNSLRGRIFAGTPDTWPGGYRLYVSNGSTTNRPHAAVLSTNRSYVVVTRYEIDTATTTLWVNPASEADPGAIATDPQSPVSVTSYGFRQDSAFRAAVFIDDLRVGLSFAAVTTNSPAAVPLAISREGGILALRWNDPAWVLQSGPGPAGPFTNVLDATSPFRSAPNGPARFFRLQPSPGLP